MSQPPTMLFCAGAVKAGTTWLYEYLREHPDTYFRTIKEMQYFDRLYGGNLKPRAKKLAQEIAAMEADLESGRAKWPAWVLRQIGDRAEYRKLILSGDAPTAEYLRYLTAGAGDKRLVGEMTPEYGLLNVPQIREISAMAPDVRWVFLMRDPVSRLWSHVRMLVRRTKPSAEAFAAACEAKFEEVLAGKAKDVSERGDYAAIHGRLARAVAADKRLVMIYEQLLSSDGVAQVTGFLGIANHPAKLDKRVHEGVAVDMPEALRVRAREWLRPQYAFVAQTFGLPPEWESFPELRSEVA
ncbi:MAG: sulfotransferase [bacterium]